MKWYEKLLIVLLVIVFSPIIITFLIISAVVYLFSLPKNVKNYKNSFYYKEFGLLFRQYILYSPEYRFFNSFKKRNLKLEYIRQESNGLEYFIYENTIFLFPDFDQISRDDEEKDWEVNYDGNWKSFEEAYRDITSKLENVNPDYEIKLLVERSMFTEFDLRGVFVPESIFITWNYETAFEDEASPLKLIVPVNTQELYEMMLATPKLCGEYKISEDGSICWNIFQDIQINISVDESDCYFAVNKAKFGKVQQSITHWHPSHYEIYNDVCSVGMLGNVLVIRTALSHSSVLYKGREKDCPFSANRKKALGKYYFLKAK